MKKNILVIAITVTVAMLGFSACKRDFSLKSPVSSPTGSAYLRIIDAAPGFKATLGFADSFSVFVNGAKISGNTPGATYLMTFGSSFPTASSLNGYVAVPAGSAQVIKLSLSGTVTADSIAIASFTKTLAADQYYTFMITDSIKSTRDSSQIFVQDSYTQPTPGYYNLRFIHAVWNDTTGKNIDVFSTRNNKNIYTNIKPGTITAFSQYPYNASLTDTFYVRRTGSPTIVLDTLINTSLFTNQRTYTLYYKGDGTTNYANNVKHRHMVTYVHQ